MGSITLPLAIAQTVIWASIFYLFPAFLPTWELETPWDKTELTGAFTLALLIAAATSPKVGRAIDSGNGRTLMLCGNLAAIVLLILLSQTAALWQFYGIWMLMGLCMAASLYEPCFAMLIRHLGTDAKPSITRITLIAGLAGTVAFPTAHYLNARLDWRIAILCYAAAVGLITLPLTAWSMGNLQNRFPVAKPLRTDQRAKVPFGRTFWMLALTFMIIAIVHGMIITHLLPLLAERGVATNLAILAASLVGPMQVFGRLVMVATEARITTFTTAVACYAGMALGCTALLFAGASPLLILSFVIVHGGSYGVTSIIRPMLTREMLGSASFGQISGRMGGLFMLGTAVAPFGGSLIWQMSGYQTMLVLCIALLVLGMAMLLYVRPDPDLP
ncbi:MAG: MFS transporter [Rhizobiaceae bacterium]